MQQLPRQPVAITALCSTVVAVSILSAVAMPQTLHAAEHATITLYHHISETTPASTSVAPAKFREQLEHLRTDGFNVIPLPDLLDALHERRELPDKTLAITFDDGYISIYDTAFPMLQEFGFPFTVFINTQPHNDRMRGYMSWEQIREMSDAGVTIANHMENHPHMVDTVIGEDESARIARLQAELLRSQGRITEMTGQNHQFMAYPYGEYDVPVKRMVEALGLVAFGQQSGAVGFDSDFLALPRFPFGGSFTDLNDFKQKVQTQSFHLTSVDPETPMTTVTNPSITLQFAPGNFNFRQIGCYAGGQPLQMEWLDQENGLVRLSTGQNFTTRRFRYLCTAPVREAPGRFYWYSKDWTRTLPDNRD